MGWKRSPKLLASRLEKIQRKVVRETSGATGQVARALDSDLRKRVRPAKQISKQDDPQGRARNLSRNKPVSVDWSTRPDGISIRARLSGHYTGARSEALRGVMRYLGRERELVRTGLLVVPGPRRNRARQKEASGYRAHRVEFSHSSRLSVWSQRSTKGLQVRRNVIELDSRILEAMILDPVLRKKKKAFLAAWKRGMKEGFLGA